MSGQIKYMAHSGRERKRKKKQNILYWRELIVCLCNANFQLNKVCKCHFVSVESPDDVVTHLYFWYSGGAACQLITLGKKKSVDLQETAYLVLLQKCSVLASCQKRCTVGPSACLKGDEIKGVMRWSRKWKHWQGFSEGKCPVCIINSTERFTIHFRNIEQ